MGPRILAAAILAVIGLWLVKLLNRWITTSLSKKRIDPSVRSFLQSIIATVLKILLLLGIMQILGIQMTIFAAVVASFSVAAGLALSGTLQNFASGVLILLLKPYRVGDNIITQGQEGTVTGIQLFYTTILTFDNKTVIVPNSKLSNEVIINLSREGIRRLDIELKFNYSFDFEQLRAVITKCIEDFKKIEKVPEYRLGVSALESDGYRFMINVWTAAHGFQDTRLLFQQKLMEELKAAGIKLSGMA